MKYLVLLLIVVGGIWWIRQQRKTNHTSSKQSGPQVMLPCAHCGAHVPENEVIHGLHGTYCSQKHRESHEA